MKNFIGLAIIGLLALCAVPQVKADIVQVNGGGFVQPVAFVQPTFGFAAIDPCAGFVRPVGVTSFSSVRAFGFAQPVAFGGRNVQVIQDAGRQGLFGRRGAQNVAQVGGGAAMLGGGGSVQIVQKSGRKGLFGRRKGAQNIAQVN